MITAIIFYVLVVVVSGEERLPMLRNFQTKQGCVDAAKFINQESRGQVRAKCVLDGVEVE